MTSLFSSSFDSCCLILSSQCCASCLDVSTISFNELGVAGRPNNRGCGLRSYPPRRELVNRPPMHPELVSKSDLPQTPDKTTNVDQTEMENILCNMNIRKSYRFMSKVFCSNQFIVLLRLSLSE